MREEENQRRSISTRQFRESFAAEECDDGALTMKRFSPLKCDATSKGKLETITNEQPEMATQSCSISMFMAPSNAIKPI